MYLHKFTGMYGSNKNSYMEVHLLSSTGSALLFTKGLIKQHTGTFAFFSA